MSFSTLAIVVMVLSAPILKAQPNPPRSIVLPPADWDVHQHILASLVITNKPGDYALQPAWVGDEKVTTRE